jgi:flagellar motor switch protein FliM
MSEQSDIDDMKNSMLDQSEIDKLLEQAEAETAPSLLRADGKRAGHEELGRVEAYDFRNPTFLTEVELRRLRILHEDFIRYLAARLSLMLRMDCGMKMSRLQTQTFEKFSEGLSSPTHICLFKVEPLVGVGVLDINPRLAITLVDRLLGGKGHSVKAERYLTELEVALLEDILKVVLEEWCAQWKDEEDVHPTIIGHENNGRFLQTSPRDAVVLAMSIECNFGDCSEPLQIGVPFYTIEPLVKSLQQRRHKEVATETTINPMIWKPIYAQIQVPVQVEWQLPGIALRECTVLRVGDIIELPISIIDEAAILLNGTKKFQGTVGIEGDHVAVKITRKLGSEDLRPSDNHE